MTQSVQGPRSRAAAAVAIRVGLALALSLASSVGLAELPHEPFRVTRPLFPSGAGPARANVDVPLLAGAEPGGALRDLRLTRADGSEVPYILVEPRESAPERWVPGKISAISPTATQTGFELDLGHVARVDRLRLGGLPRSFLKQARVEGAGDRTHYTVLIPRVVVFDLPDEQLEGLEVALPEGLERYLRVTWDDHATSSLPLPGRAEAREASETTAPEALRADVPFERRPSHAGESRFRIHLPGPGLPLVALEVAAGGDHLLRPARVTEPQLRGDEVQPVELGSATLRRSTRDGLSASALRVPVAHAKGTELELVVEDGDNPPLDLTRVSAVLAPQPWIYLEAPGAAPLVAHYGNARLTAPHYDLEAARGGLEKLSPPPALATWGDPRPEMAPPPSEDVPPVALVGAALDVGGFGVTREILAGARERADPAASLAAVQLDAAVLAHSATLADVRIRDAAGHQVPYLLERQEEPTVVPLSLERVTQALPPGFHTTPGTSLYRVAIPFADLPAGRLVLTTGARVFKRQVTVLAPREAGASPRDPELTSLGARVWTHADADTPAPAFALPYTARGATAIYVQVDEGDNAPLPLEHARLELPGVRLRFFRSAAASLTLLYGNPSMPPPRYDLALLAPKLAGAVAAELKLAPETVVSAAAAPEKPGMPLFWVALLTAVVVLIVIMGGLLRRVGPAE